MNCHGNAWDQAFFAHLPNISNSVEFAAHLFQLYWRQILVNMHPIINFSKIYYDAYDDHQKNYYLKNEICKPFGVSPVDNKAFHRLDLLNHQRWSPKIQMVQYYRDLWPRQSHILEPFTKLLSGKNKNKPIEWTDELQFALKMPLRK